MVLIMFDGEINNTDSLFTLCVLTVPVTFWPQSTLNNLVLMASYIFTQYKVAKVKKIKKIY